MERAVQGRERGNRPPFLPPLRALDNPSGGSNSLFEGQFHRRRRGRRRCKRLCRIGDGNTSWTLLSLSPSAARSPFLSVANWSRVQEMGLLNFKSMLMLPRPPPMWRGRREGGQTAGGEGQTDCPTGTKRWARSLNEKTGRSAAAANAERGGRNEKGTRREG